MIDANKVKHIFEISISGSQLQTVVPTEVFCSDKDVRDGALACLFLQVRLHLTAIRDFVHLDNSEFDTFKLEQLFSLIAMGTVRFGENHHRVFIDKSFDFVFLTGSFYRIYAFSR